MKGKNKSPKTKAYNLTSEKDGSERRQAERKDTFYQVSLLGNYGTFNAYVTNLSHLGALVDIDNAELSLPSETKIQDLLNQTLKDQFGKGFVIQFLGTDLALHTDVVHARVMCENSRIHTIMGCRFRQPLSRNECICLQLEPPPTKAIETPSLLPPTAFETTGVENAESYHASTPIRELMVQAVEAGATDLHIKVGGKPRIRVSGVLSEIGEDVITHEIAHFMALDLISAEQANRFELEGDVELTTSLENAGRFRINIYRQQGYTGIAIRCIPDKIPTIDSLGLSPVAVTLAEKPHGLVLVTGPTGSGKSTTLA
ncbi:MAG: ATPase, T2SS/T4P/T4SS family, partial [Planctomycetota bacterium]